jgi:surfeit locus 1 family protein
MRRMLFPLFLGLGGIAILMSLGFWQLHRLEWKETILANIAAQINKPPTDIAEIGDPDPVAQRYQPVKLSGKTLGAEILVLSGKKNDGAGYEVISAFETTGGRRILVDRGFIPEELRNVVRPPVALSITGNLDWPMETDSFTPPPDTKTGLWFARDVAKMAENLRTDPLLVVVKQADGDTQSIDPVPVDTSGIPNDHLQYAITWFSLAGVWVGMTAYLLWRIRQRTT